MRLARRIAQPALAGCAFWCFVACHGSTGDSSNCGLPAGEYESVAQGCSTGITAASGAPTYSAALSDTSYGCGMSVQGENCGGYLRVLVYGPPSEGPATLYYYEEVGGALVAVVQRDDGFGDTCLAGPGDFVEPCDQSCTATSSADTTACSDAGSTGDAGHGGG